MSKIEFFDEFEFNCKFLFVPLYFVLENEGKIEACVEHKFYIEFREHMLKVFFFEDIKIRGKCKKFVKTTPQNAKCVRRRKS